MLMGQKVDLGNRFQRKQLSDETAGAEFMKLVDVSRSGFVSPVTRRCSDFTRGKTLHSGIIARLQTASGAQGSSADR